MTNWMVVDDEPDIYEIMLALCNIVGVDGVPFMTGDEAFEWIEAVDNGQIVLPHDLPDIALLNIWMPGIVNGIMIGERLRQSPHLRDITIVLMTASELSAQDKRIARELTGASAILYKPLPDLKALKHILYDALTVF